MKPQSKYWFPTQSFSFSLGQERSRAACITSIVHQADQVLRKYIAKLISEAKGQYILTAMIIFIVFVKFFFIAEPPQQNDLICVY